MLHFIQKIGFYRLLLIPIGIAIIISAYINGILGMGIIGGIVIIFGVLNKCLLLGKCEVDIPKKTNSLSQTKNYK